MDQSPGKAHFAATSYPLGYKTVSNNDADDEPVVGMWHVLFTAKGNGGGPPDGTPIDNALVVLHGDKTGDYGFRTAPQDGEFCVGVWEKTGPSKYLSTITSPGAATTPPTRPQGSATQAARRKSLKRSS